MGNETFWFSQLINQNIWLAVIMTFVVGLVSSFSPCTLSTISLVIGYVNGASSNDKRKAFIYSLSFCIGLVVVFTMLGIASATLGWIMTGAGKWWYIVLSIIMLGIGLQLLGVININPMTCRVPNIGKGLTGAFIFGILGGFLASPCATPVLAAILAFVSGQGNILLGALLLISYSLGHCIVVMASGVFVGVIKELSTSNRANKVGEVLKIVLGGLILLIGLYMFYIGI